jgi:hypothetical protein
MYNSVFYKRYRDNMAEYKEKASEKKENKPKVVYAFHCDL